MNYRKSLLVCGSVRIDIIARATGTSNSTVKPGDIILDIGGAANSIAMAIKTLGIPTHILTVQSKKSPYASIITRHLADAGIELHLQQEDGIPDAAFCALVNENGEVYSAISSVAIEQVKFHRDIFEPAIDNACCLIIDCDISLEAITHLTRYANSVDVPVFVSVTSEEKSTKITDINVKFSGIFMNQQKMIWLTKYLELNPSASALAKYFNCPIVVTNGNEGAILAEPNDPDMHHFDSAAIDVGSGKDYIGAGYTVVAHTVAHYIFGKKKIKEAIGIAMMAAEESAACRQLNLMNGGGIGEVIQSINNAAAIDYLTNLPNRATASRKLEQMAGKNANCFIALIDIDFFKKINDTYGHDAGDIVLMKVAETISSVMRESDFCARWGGEEFLCVLGRGINTIDEAINIMERARRTVESIPLEHGKITVSVGISLMSDDIDMAIKRADEALYKSKKSGRNMVSVN